MKQAVEKKQSRDIEKSSPSREVQRQAPAEIHLRPPVDIYEDDHALTLKADLPGVAREQLNISVDDRTLSIEATLDLNLSEGMGAIYADLRSNKFRRSFTLSEELETENIDAQLKDGVLTLTIPKREELRPRRIEVKTG